MGEPELELELESPEPKKKDPYFKLFQWVCEHNPSQVLRYCRHAKDAEPLWYHSTDRITAEMLDHPLFKKRFTCQQCGQPRLFELQLMPQLFHFVPQLACVDWATIVIYT